MKTSYFLYLIVCIIVTVLRIETIRASGESEQATKPDTLISATVNGSTKVVVALGPVRTIDVSIERAREAKELGFFVLPAKIRNLSVDLIGGSQSRASLWQTDILYQNGVEPELVINGLLVRDGFIVFLYTTSKTHLVLIPTESNIQGLPHPKEFVLAESTAFSSIKSAHLIFNKGLSAAVHLSSGSQLWRVTSEFELEALESLPK